MIPKGNLNNNIERFSGFESEYNLYRPQAPEVVVDLLTMYLGQSPAMVVDLGCGTGLSTFIWKDCAKRVIGVEPNDDMRGKAGEMLAKLSHRDARDVTHLSFLKGYSNQIDVASASVDVVTCSQSFHWMEPISTLQEAVRVLRDGGIFAAYDCDWPASVNWRVEVEYNDLMAQVDTVLAEHESQVTQAQKWPKERHLQNLIDSHAFRYTKEITFHKVEQCNADRYVGLALSQGGLQTVLKGSWVDLSQSILRFREAVEAHFDSETLPILFSYRMRMGIK